MNPNEPLTSLENCKVYVGQHSEAIQRKAFKLGYKWIGGRKEVINTDYPFLYFTRDRYGRKGIDFGDRQEIFNCHPTKEVTPEQILAIDEKATRKAEEEFKPFDRVLMADKGDEWKPFLFEHRGTEGERPCYIAISHSYPFDYCIPYKGNEHLAFTKCQGLPQPQ